ncbi:LOW QUALITY PROTEIN: GDSL esterase/lipase At4g26790-like [Salvia miltiorrhiza]|uniref:LOW QUALITY PROTEIN: GDSL esterase/lipase At4g26790-like n=1 Tax=Salvia miltiorrhiza TaxID=226208 RepID=UPI0025ACD810|nr:LOW QUALITY PROTEIN: GDSL esterase/lipase At4g26790-like [Salvia miltiorrhiza]
MKMAAVSLLFVLLLQKSEAKVSSIIVFGDSSVDSGNNNYIPTVLKSNFKPYGRDFEGGKATGRFSNGRIATDYISEAFGLKPTIPAYLDPAYTIQDFATGVCFASAGTGNYDNATSKLLSVMPLWKEVEYYKEYQIRLRNYVGNHKANQLLREALYIISIGTNDFLENYYLLPHRRLEFSIEDYQQFLAGIAKQFVTQIYELGARKICLTGLPPMGCLPLERTTNLGKCIHTYNDVAVAFNGKLEGLVQSLNKDLSTMQLVLSAPYAVVYDIIQNPHAYGFEHSAKACCGSGRFEMSYLCDNHNPLTCSDATKYVFWDSFHPTDRTNAIVAQYVFNKFLAVFQ